MNKKTIIDEMKSYYDQRAQWHDEYMSYNGVAKMESRYAPIIETFEPLIKNQSVLEIACGTGNWTSVLARRANKVIAIDSSKQSLEIAQNKHNEIDNITFHNADAFALENLHESFDVIFASDFFSHVPREKINSFLEMLNKISKAGSVVIFLEMSEKVEFQQERARLDKHNNRVSVRELPDGSSYDVIKNFYTEKELLDIFTKYGTDVKYSKFESLQRWILEFKTQ